MYLTRRKIIIGIIIVFVILPIAAAVVYYLFFPKQDNKEEAYRDSTVAITRDKDTGVLLENDPNIRDASEAREVIVLGLPQLIEQGLVATQVTFIKDQLDIYSKDILKNKYETLTIRPQDLVNNGGIFTSTIRLGQTDIILPITITALNTGESRIVITADPDDPSSAAFDSGTTYFRGD